MNDLASADPNIQTAMLEVISEGVSGGLLVYDRNDQVVFASQQLVSLLPVPKGFLAAGTRLRDFLGAVYDSGGRFAADAVGPRRMLSREDWIAEQIASLWKERAETLERRGTDRWLSFTKKRLSSGYGVTVVRDVSEHKKREEQWRADMERVQITEEVLDNLPFSVTVKDSKSVFVAVNKAASRFLDLPPEAILGHKSDDIHPPELTERLSGINQKILQDGEPVQLPELVTRANGSQTAIIANKYRIGKPGRYYVVTAMEDITGLVELGDSEVAARMSGGGLIQTSLGRHQRGSHDAETASVPVDARVLSGRKVLVASQSQDAGSEAMAVLGGLGIDASSVISADELQLFLELATASGIGIDLVVVDTAMEDITHEIARRHGIRSIGLDTNRIGTELASALEHAFAKPQEKAVEPVADVVEIEVGARVSKIDILVAEDNEVNQIVFSQILEGLGYSYAIAADGEEALKLWEETAPRLILMDITLPKLTGFEAAAKIRGLETVDNSIPIIGVLPQAFDRDRDECYASGMNDVILKPISPEALETLFETYLDKSEKKSYA